MAPPNFSQSHVTCCKEKEEGLSHHQVPYSSLLSDHETGIESSLACLISELAGLSMLAPPDLNQAEQLPHRLRSHNLMLHQHQQKGSSYCSNFKRERHSHPYTRSPHPQNPETGIKSSIDHLVIKLAGLMLVPSNNNKGVQQPQYLKDYYVLMHQHQQQIDQTHLQQQHQLHHLIQQFVPALHWKEVDPGVYGLVPWGPFHAAFPISIDPMGPIPPHPFKFRAVEEMAFRFSNFPSDFSGPQEKCGFTPLHAAVIAYSRGCDSEEAISSVRFLLENGADPNILTENGKPIWVFLDCGLRSSKITTLLVQRGLDLSLRNPDTGVTLIHSWAMQVNTDPENLSLDMVKMLIENGADLQARDDHGFTVIGIAAKGDGFNHPNLLVLDFLLERDDITRMDKIDALEFAGAVNSENQAIFPLAFQYWRRALSLRQMDTEECRPIYKTPMTSKSGQLSEWSTLDDLLQIEQDPSQREIQSVLVFFRMFFCSGLSWEFVEEVFVSFISHYLNIGVGQHRTFSQLLDISSTAMEKIFRFDPVQSNLLRYQTVDMIRQLIPIFLNLPNDDDNFNSASLKTLLKLVEMTDQLHIPDANLKSVAGSSHFINLYHTVLILSRRSQMVTKDMERSLKEIVRHDCRDPSGLNLLLLSCHDFDDVSISIITLLLKLKADTNAVNNVGNSPLHLLAVQLENTEIRDTIARLLLENGAHLDIANNERKTPAQLWLEKNNRQGMNVGLSDLPDWLKEECPLLLCLCARVVRRHNLPFDDKANLPATLISFVKMH